MPDMKNAAHYNFNIGGIDLNSHKQITILLYRCFKKNKCSK